MSAVPAKLFVVSGPSGAGKGTLVTYARKRFPSLALAISATTRHPRAGERDGIQYHFLSDGEFDRLVEHGDFLEWACVHEHRYGTLRSEVDRLLAAGESPLLEIDVQGALRVRSLYPDAVLIFIKPPSLEELARRLRARGTEDESSLSVRLKNAEAELAQAHHYDECVVNDVLDVACAAFGSIIEKHLTDGGHDDVCD